MDIAEPEGMGGRASRAPYLWAAAALVVVIILVVSALGVGRPKGPSFPRLEGDDRPVVHWEPMAAVDRSGSLRSYFATEPQTVTPTCEAYGLAYDVVRVWINLSWSAAPEGSERLRLMLYKGGCDGEVLREAAGSSPLSIDLLDGRLLNAQVSTEILPDAPGLVVAQPYALTLTPWRIVFKNPPSGGPT